MLIPCFTGWDKICFHDQKTRFFQALKEAAMTQRDGAPSRSAAALIHASNAYLTLGMADEACLRIRLAMALHFVE